MRCNWCCLPAPVRTSICLIYFCGVPLAREMEHVICGSDIQSRAPNHRIADQHGRPTNLRKLVDYCLPILLCNLARKHEDGELIRIGVLYDPIDA